MCILLNLWVEWQRLTAKVQAHVSDYNGTRTNQIVRIKLTERKGS